MAVASQLSSSSSMISKSPVSVFDNDPSEAATSGGFSFLEDWWGAGTGFPLKTSRLGEAFFAKRFRVSMQKATFSPRTNRETCVSVLCQLNDPNSVCSCIVLQVLARCDDLTIEVSWGFR